MTPPPMHGGQLRHIAARFNIPAEQLLDFSANINPEGPPSTVLESLRQSLADPATLTAYPDLEETDLKLALATYTGLAPANIAVSNGFVPLLRAAFEGRRIRHCLLPVPAFVEYRRSLTQAGIRITPHALDHAVDFRYDLQALVTGDHDAILLANPQNPSGVLTGKAVLLELVARAATRNITVLLDEAFIDYAPGESLTAEIERHPNLVVFRSLTKFFAVPGLRVAYAASSASNIAALSDALAPWPITTLASRAIAAAIADHPFADHTRSLNEQRRSSLAASLQALGLATYPSAANFLLLRLHSSIDPDRLWRRMIERHGIVLRACTNYESLPSGHLRSAVRTELDNARLIEAIRQILTQG
jgi:threonine-phosphate decarboxylase